MSRLSTVSSLAVTILAAASFACSSAVPASDNASTSACTNCGSSAIVSGPAPSATVTPDAPFLIPAELGDAPTPHIDAGAGESEGDAGPDGTAGDASHGLDGGGCILVDVPGDTTTFEGHCS